jgi:hypothetical protein
MASICGCQSSIRGTIHQCNAAVASSMIDQKPITNHHNQWVSLTYQRQAAFAAAGGKGCSDMQNVYQVCNRVTVKLSPPSAPCGKPHGK